MSDEVSPPDGEGVRRGKSPLRRVFWGIGISGEARRVNNPAGSEGGVKEGYAGCTLCMKARPEKKKSKPGYAGLCSTEKQP